MKRIAELVSKTAQTLFGSGIPDGCVTVDITPDAALGDWAVGCFQLARHAGKRPDEVAGLLAQELKKSPDLSDAQTAGGYLNVKASAGFLAKAAAQFQPSSAVKGEGTVVVDYIGPNASKPLHIGHLCTPSFGQASINALRFQGYTVIGDTHIGDWGGVFGKLIVGWKRAVAREGLAAQEAKKATDGIYHLVTLYQEVSADVEKEEAARKAAEEAGAPLPAGPTEEACRQEFKKLSEGDEENMEIWRSFTEISVAGIRQQAARLRAFPDYDIGESFYEGLALPRLGNQPALLPDEKMSAVVAELVAAGVAGRNADGSCGIEFPKAAKLPSVMLQKRDGTHGYLASDLACIKYRLRVFKPKKIVYFVDMRQQTHFKQCFATAKAAWIKDGSVELAHAANGFIKTKEGAMSTRKGNVIFLDDVVDEADKRVKDVLAEKGRTLAPENIEKIAVTALKWSVLSQDRERDIVFDWDKILALEGNSGPYVLYALVRARKMLAELGTPGGVPTDAPLTQYDRDLVRLAWRFETMVDRAAAQYKPHHLAQYAFELASSFNSFYANAGSVKNEADAGLKAARTHLVAMVERALAKAFEILALPVPEEM